MTGPLSYGPSRRRHPQPAEDLAELAVRWPAVPIVFAETWLLAEDWTYRYLAAAHAWVLDDLAVSAYVNLAAETELADSQRSNTGPTPTDDQR
jgi:hypothetical protein